MIIIIIIIRRRRRRRTRSRKTIISPNSSIRQRHKNPSYQSENSKCRLCGDMNETINHKISECSKLSPKEYKIRHDRVGKLINREMVQEI